ncbi:hypothetical protein MRY82_06950 [bacterium]|nr:hypothetical protein [bacterium]
MKILNLFLSIYISSCGLGNDVLSRSDFIEDRDVALEIIDGNEQSGVVNQPLANALVVKTIDDEALPASNERVEFRVVEGTASVTSVAYTNSSGLAEANVTVGPNPENIKIRAYWPKGDREVFFDVFGSLAILKINSAPGFNNEPKCVRENEEFSVPVVIELIGANNTPIANTDIVVSINNGSLDQTAFESSVTYTTASNGKITFDVVAGVTEEDEYKKDIRVTAIVPSMIDTQPIVLDLETTKDKFIEALSPETQYAFSPEFNVDQFTFFVRVFGECDAILEGEPVQFERRWTAKSDSPCAYDAAAPHYEDWYVHGTTLTNAHGYTAYSPDLEVEYLEQNIMLLRHNDVRASLFNSVNSNIPNFKANHYICGE